MQTEFSQNVKFPLIRFLVLSKHLDIAGALVVFLTSVARNFQGTVFYKGRVEFGVPMDELLPMIQNGAYPLGIMAIIGAVFSMLSTRLVGKQNNWGNGIGIATTVNSGANDYLFGNHSALLTYPITFIVTSFATYNWYKGERIRKKDARYYLIILTTLLVAYIFVYIGFNLFGGLDSTLFFHTVAISFGLSLGANVCSSLKYEETWLSWAIYNAVQLVKNLIQMNIANVAKYIFYLVNAVITLIDWKWNGDRTVYSAAVQS